MVREEWDNNVEASYEYLLKGKTVLKEEEETFATQVKCIELALEYFKTSSVHDIGYPLPELFLAFVSWCDVATVKWLISHVHGLSLDMVDGSFIFSLQLNLFANKVAKFIVEEKLKSGCPSKDLEWVIYLALLRCDVDLLSFMSTKVDLRDFFKRYPKFLSQFVRYVRAEGGLNSVGFWVPSGEDQGLGMMIPIDVEGELLDDDYNPKVCVEFVQYLIENGAAWDDECTKELDYYQGYLKDELSKFKTINTND
jgi:hypothetical protein